MEDVGRHRVLDESALVADQRFAEAEVLRERKGGAKTATGGERHEHAVSRGRRHCGADRFGDRPIPADDRAVHIEREEPVQTVDQRFARVRPNRWRRE